MEYHMLYVKSRISFDVRRQFFYYFAMCQNKIHGKVVSKKAQEKVFLCRVQKKKAQGKP